LVFFSHLPYSYRKGHAEQAIGFNVDSPESLKAELIELFGGNETEPLAPITKWAIATLLDPNNILVRLFPKT